MLTQINSLWGEEDQQHEAEPLPDQVAIFAMMVWIVAMMAQSWTSILKDETTHGHGRHASNDDQCDDEDGRSDWMLTRVIPHHQQNEEALERSKPRW